MVEQYVSCKDVYKTRKFIKTLNLDEFIEKYVEISKMERYCSLCKNYGKSWECPPHTINVEDYWKHFNKIKIIAVKLDYDDNFRNKSYNHEELNYIMAL
ncbi:DUF2284 domain-containing protein [Methanobrevibacter sp.]|uniref:DUF2284 domain-containing protein n=1 Tax=Methanobrevibacter sp. TaxID=66852 RepID=UPI002E77F8D6|nr:DUF2284 domain-containing protein [Methanobrevibacter sp.]MEE0025764.1 DUF2284 domain-containing protein [Methanobrevibacter sp.]